MSSTLDIVRSSISAPAEVVPSAFLVPLDGSRLSLRAVVIASWFAERFGPVLTTVRPERSGR